MHGRVELPIYSCLDGKLVIRSFEALWPVEIHGFAG